MKIAIVQRSAVFNDLTASIALARDILHEAASNGSQLVIFGECWLCGYPAWIDHATNYTKWDDPKTKQVFASMHANSITLGSGEWRNLLSATKEAGVVAVMGINEIDSPSTGTIYNSVVVIDKGELVLHHRKLMPTYTEKLLYGTGDGRGLRAADTSVGRIGALICWEHWMPLVRQALHDSSETIHIALWPQVHEMLQIASRHYAFEGRRFVVAAGQIMHSDQMPDSLGITSGRMLLNGGSSIIGPDGKYLLEPQYETDGILYSELPDGMSTIAERMTLDVSGHYQRKDLFEFNLRLPID